MTDIIFQHPADFRLSATRGLCGEEGRARFPVGRCDVKGH
jgi:hypothetical protein